MSLVHNYVLFRIVHPHYKNNYVHCNHRKSGNITKIICGRNHTFFIKGKICQKCGCFFTPKPLSEEMLMATKIPGICSDMIYKIIKLCARMSENPDCSKGGCCYY